MKRASSYEPGDFESDIYAAWESAGVFQPTITTLPVDNDGNGVDDRKEVLEDETSLSEDHKLGRAASSVSEKDGWLIYN